MTAIPRSFDSASVRITFRTESYGMLNPKTSRWNLRLLAATAACCLSACGGEDMAGIQGSGAPVAAGVTSVGAISGFGSVFLGGVEYDTSAAQVRIDDLSGTEA